MFRFKVCFLQFSISSPYSKIFILIKLQHAAAAGLKCGTLALKMLNFLSVGCMACFMNIPGIV